MIKKENSDSFQTFLLQAFYSFNWLEIPELQTTKK